MQPRVPPSLARYMSELNEEQQAAVLHEDSVVVRAGPGSGKTRVLVSKVGYLLSAVIPNRQGVAAITYTNQAAREVTHRLGRLGLHPGRQLASRTVHSWCLQAVILPYGELTGHAAHVGGIVSDRQSIAILDKCLSRAGAPYRRAEWEQSLITAIRRSMAVGESLYKYDPAKVQAALLYENELAQANQSDYESLVLQALRIIQDSEHARDLLSSKYPWILVDEYQDLGAVVHQIVQDLHGQAGVKVFAVGDPDQTIMGFSGADPRYLNELAASEDFLDVELKINYRSGSAIVAASHAVLQESRPHESHASSGEGTIEAVFVEGGLENHAIETTIRVRRLLEAGEPYHEIAILYPSRGPLRDALVSKFIEEGLPFIDERDQQLPRSGITDFLRLCAARRIAGPLPGSASAEHSGVPSVRALATGMVRSMSLAGMVGVSTKASSRALWLVLGDLGESEESAVELIDRLRLALPLERWAAASSEDNDSTAINEIREVAARLSLSVEDLAGAEFQRNRVVLTTYHSAKGREFGAVVMPGLVEGIMPRLEWSKVERSYIEPARALIAESRRSFYVALTRARQSVTLIYGQGWETSWGDFNEYGPSRFVVDVLSKIA